MSLPLEPCIAKSQRMSPLPDSNQPTFYMCRNQIFYKHHCTYSPIHCRLLYHDELSSDHAKTISHKTQKIIVWKRHSIQQHENKDNIMNPNDL